MAGSGPKLADAQSEVSGGSTGLAPQRHVSSQCCTSTRAGEDAAQLRQPFDDLDAGAPGAQLRITDHEGWRITVLATNSRGGRLTDLDIRHRLRARAEDRIRGLKDTGATNLPLQPFDKNQIWLELAQLAAELLTWTQLLAWADLPARVWEPKRIRLRLLAVAGRVITTGRRRIMRLSQRWPWADLVVGGHRRLAALT